MGTSCLRRALRWSQGESESSASADCQCCPCGSESWFSGCRGVLRLVADAASAPVRELLLLLLVALLLAVVFLVL